jgi:hypothetical protein
MSEPTQSELEALASRYADIVMDIARIPVIMAHSEELLEIARADGCADSIRVFETANLLAKLRYGKIGGIERRVKLAEKLRNVKQGETVQSSGIEKEINRALLADDRAIFSDLDKAYAMIDAQPSATSDARFFALIITRDFRLAGMEPTKGDVREEVERLMEKHGRSKGTVKWQRDVWPSHPELVSLPHRGKAKAPQRLPEE